MLYEMALRPGFALSDFEGVVCASQSESCISSPLQAHLSVTQALEEGGDFYQADLVVPEHGIRPVVAVPRHLELILEYCSSSARLISCHTSDES